MQTLLIDASNYSSSRSLHEALRILLKLPDYYGMNADALHDCLAERPEPVNLWIASSGDGDVARALSAVCAAVADLGGSVKKI